VPSAFFIKPEDSAFELPFNFPVIVKPNFGDSSFGITERSFARTPEELIDAILEIRQKLGYEKPILVEEFLPGKDLSVGIIGTPPSSYSVLRITEEDYSALPSELPKICGYEAKWCPDSPYWKIKSVPAQLSDETEKALVTWCMQISERLECRDYVRSDWRLDAEGKPRLLEVNPNPGWCWDGHLAKMAAYSGMSYPEMLGAILRAAEERLGLEATESKKCRDEGEKQLRQGLSLSPDAADLHHALGLLLVRKADKTAALQEFAVAAKLAPDNARYAYVYAIGLNSAGKQREALAVLKAANAHQPYDLDILSVLISMQREAGDNKAALVYARKAAEALPDNAAIKQLIAELETVK
jgi:hypothetical protein